MLAAAWFIEVHHATLHDDDDGANAEQIGYLQSPGGCSGDSDRMGGGDVQCSAESQGAHKENPVGQSGAFISTARNWEPIVSATGRARWRSSRVSTSSRSFPTKASSSSKYYKTSITAGSAPSSKMPLRPPEMASQASGPGNLRGSSATSRSATAAGTIPHAVQ